MREKFFDFDWHVHTEWSYCSEPPLTLDDIARRAREIGLRGFAITDHSPHIYFDSREAWRYKFISDFAEFEEVRERGNARFRQYIAEVRRYSHAGVLVGSEVEISLSGELIIDEEILGELDVVIGAVHWLPHLKDDGMPPTLVKNFLDSTLRLLESDIDILAHPTRIFKRAGKPVPKETYEPIIKKAAETGVAIEINCHQGRDPDVEFVRMCIERGVPIALSSDTHNIAELGDFREHREILDAVGAPWSEIEPLILTPERLSARRRRSAAN